MARNANPESAGTTRKGRQVSATIPAPLFDALDDHRWDARINGMTELTRLAVEEYAVNHDVVAKFEAKQAAGQDSPAE